VAGELVRTGHVGSHAMDAQAGAAPLDELHACMDDGCMHVERLLRQEVERTIASPDSTRLNGAEGRSIVGTWDSGRDWERTRTEHRRRPGARQEPHHRAALKERLSYRA
jgi:hypothetical protein